jgi:hypothetical protein
MAGFSRVYRAKLATLVILSSCAAHNRRRDAAACHFKRNMSGDEICHSGSDFFCLLPLFGQTISVIARVRLAPKRARLFAAPQCKKLMAYGSCSVVAPAAMTAQDLLC